ncbi:Crp/Fnr family transcriptional regulator [Nonomuraea sp. NPDC052129]|uniref:Crp/Fnr family transcriptional regulator n=1 Tax=Nonomuraea sp. NPDC052129 TaxID=3154651 RepID=UPI003429C3CD
MLLDLGVHRSHPAGDRLIRQGATGDAVLVLLDSVVMVTAGVENGAETLVAIRVSGDIIGEMAVLDNTTRFASVITCRRSLISHVAGSAFMEFLHQHPAAAVSMNQLLGERLRQANRRRLDFTGYDVDVRLARALIELAGQHGHRQAGATDVGVRLSHAEYGALIGANKDSVQRALRQLSARGLVETGRRKVLILNLDELTNFADIAK